MIMRNPLNVFFAVLALIVAVSLTGCAQYRQFAEAGATVALKDQQAVDDDLAKGISIAPQAIPLGALARLPAGAVKCDLAELAGIQLAGCGAVTAQDVQNIVSSQLTAHFGPAASAPGAAATTVAPAPTSLLSKPAANSAVTAQARAATSEMLAAILAKSGAAPQ